MKYTSVQLVQKNGRWRGQLQYKDEEGKWKKKTKMLSATGKREAQKELEAWHLSMEEAALTLSGQNPKETVADYVSRYIEGRSSYVERSSLYGYRQLLKNQIAPGIGDIPLDDLEPDMVQDWVNDLCERYTAVVVRKAFTLLKSAMTQAVERDRLLKNPTRTVKPPKLSAPKPNAVNAEGRAALMAVLDLPDLAPAIACRTVVSQVALKGKRPLPRIDCCEASDSRERQRPPWTLYRKTRRCRTSRSARTGRWT